MKKQASDFDCFRVVGVATGFIIITVLVGLIGTVAGCGPVKKEGVVETQSLSQSQLSQFEIVALNETGHLPEKLEVNPCEVLWYNGKEYRILAVRRALFPGEMEGVAKVKQDFRAAYGASSLDSYNARIVTLQDMKTKEIIMTPMMVKVI